MKYPNLRAEYEAGGKMDIGVLSRNVNVTEEIMHDILNGNEDVSFSEAVAIHRAFGWCSRPNDGLTGYRMDYLFAPVLSTLDPRKPKTRRRMVLLKERLSEAIAYNPAPVSWLYGPILARAKEVYARMERGERVPYAECRNSITGLAVVIDAYRPESPPRSKRMGTEATA